METIEMDFWIAVGTNSNRLIVRMLQFLTLIID